MVDGQLYLWFLLWNSLGAKVLTQNGPEVTKQKCLHYLLFSSPQPARGHSQQRESIMPGYMQVLIFIRQWVLILCQALR